MTRVQSHNPVMHPIKESTTQGKEYNNSAPQIVEIPSIDEFRKLLCPERVAEWKSVGIDVDTQDGLKEAYTWLLRVYKKFRGVKPKH